MQQYQYLCSNITETKNFCHKLSLLIKKGDTIILNGDIGAGKSLITRNIIQHFCNSDTKVNSPTFNIINSYTSPKIGTINHLDLYRINNIYELEEIGIEEILQDTCFIEWGQNLGRFYPDKVINVDIEIIDENTRKINLQITRIKT